MNQTNSTSSISQAEMKDLIERLTEASFSTNGSSVRDVSEVTGVSEAQVATELEKMRLEKRIAELEAKLSERANEPPPWVSSPGVNYANNGYQANNWASQDSRSWRFQLFADAIIGRMSGGLLGGRIGRRQARWRRRWARWHSEGPQVQAGSYPRSSFYHILQVLKSFIFGIFICFGLLVFAGTMLGIVAIIFD